MLTVKDIRKHFIEALKSQSFVQDKTGVKTLELVGASFIADEPAIFGSPAKEYIERELAWYKSQSLFVADIPGETPAIWKSVASSEGKINSNYGYLIFSEQNGSQFTNVILELIANRNSRRAVMIYTRPTMHHDYCANGMSDFICTNAVQYMVRDGAIHAVVQMRSNDVVFGYRNDYAWQKFVLDDLVKQVNHLADERYVAGNIIWQVGSLHVYERHFKLIKE